MVDRRSRLSPDSSHRSAGRPIHRDRDRDRDRDNWARDRDRGGDRGRDRSWSRSRSPPPRRRRLSSSPPAGPHRQQGRQSGGGRQPSQRDRDRDREWERESYGRRRARHDDFDTDRRSRQSPGPDSSIHRNGHRNGDRPGDRNGNQRSAPRNGDYGGSSARRSRSPHQDRSRTTGSTSNRGGDGLSRRGHVGSQSKITDVMGNANQKSASPEREIMSLDERRRQRQAILARHTIDKPPTQPQQPPQTEEEEKTSDGLPTALGEIDVDSRLEFVPSGDGPILKMADMDEAGRETNTPVGTETETKSESEFDMFASESPTDEIPNGNGVATAKALDQSMLDNWDDQHGYYRVIIGELLDGRYHVQTNLGRGVFSNVVRAFDSVEEKQVAIKLIRNNETMYKAGTNEIAILERLKLADPDDRRHIIRLERQFDHKGHLCIVFEHLDINLRDVLTKFGRYVIHNVVAVRTYAHQLFLSLLLLEKTQVIHGDIKPDNMLVNEEGNLLKLSDLGSATDASEPEVTPYLVSRFYRAPEIMLGMKPTVAIDMWSVGCTLFELFTGNILFTGKSNNQMLRAMIDCRGRFPPKMLRKSPLAETHFDESAGRFLSRETDPITGRPIVKAVAVPDKPVAGKDLKSLLIPAGASRTMAEADLRDLTGLVDLLEKCLQLNPDRRISPMDALRHPFISRVR